LEETPVAKHTHESGKLSLIHITERKLRHGDRLVRIVDRIITRWVRFIPSILQRAFIRDINRVKGLLFFYGSMDALTTLFNRRSGVQQLVEAINFARIPGIGVIFLDINGFKKINDGLGHAAGDNVLRTLGTMLKHAVRGGDLAIRWGGEEVVIVILSAHGWDEFNTAFHRIFKYLHNFDEQIANGSTLNERFTLAGGGGWLEWPSNVDRRRLGQLWSHQALGLADAEMYTSKELYKDQGLLNLQSSSHRLVEGEWREVSRTQGVIL
jgi:diguanylate cyclase (GGDEF)-like protein